MRRPGCATLDDNGQPTGLVMRKDGSDMMNGRRNDEWQEESTRISSGLDGE